MSNATRIVLKRDVSRDQVGYVAYDAKWRIHSVTRESESPQRQVWITKTGDTVITFLEDPYLGLRYVVVQGAQVSEVVHLLRASLPCWTSEEALDFLRQSSHSDEKIHAVYLVAATAPGDEDPQVAATLRNVAREEDPEVRLALLVGMGYLAEWATVRSIANSLVLNDPNDEVRRSAALLLEGLDQPNVN
ncbi:HEAT repeat domain-containing protein [Streptomyces sp. SudanB182_2057]|uniref:HEAT repeat domain-containing protein n=1 Tax=Streptomyces sp. SudanB182_2057 TaxID=3035281 RepID=UPI003F5613D3